MSINIDEKKFRKALFGATPRDGLAQSMPLSCLTAEMTYDGEWIKNPNTAAGMTAIQTGFSVTRKASTTKTDPDLIVRGTLKVDTDTNIYIFFMEPHKGGFNEYQGFDCKDGATHFIRSRNGGAETATNIEPQDWTAEHEFEIWHEYDDSDVYFNIDSVEVGHHTTNISSQPFEIACAEPNGVVRNAYLKYPPGIVCYG